MFLCLYVSLWFFCPTREIFPHMETLPLREGLQIFSYARHSWPLSSEGSLACHIYCDTGHPFIMVISEDPWHSAVATSFYDLGLSLLGFIRPNFRLWGEHSNQLRHGRGYSYVYIWQCLMPCFEVYFICQEAHGLYCSPKQLWLRHFKRIAVMFVVPIWN